MDKYDKMAEAIDWRMAQHAKGVLYLHERSTFAELLRHSAEPEPAKEPIYFESLDDLRRAVVDRLRPIPEEKLTAIYKIFTRFRPCDRDAVIEECAAVARRDQQPEATDWGKGYTAGRCDAADAILRALKSKGGGE